MADEGIVYETRPGYRRRPIVVDAVRWQGDPSVLDRWMKELGSLPMVIGDGKGGANLRIETLEGPMEARIGDWIVREPFPTDDRRFYPVKPEIFEQGYETVEVEMVAPPEAVSALFNIGNEQTVGEIAKKFPPIVRVKEADSSEEQRSMLVSAGKAASEAEFRFICIDCGAGQPGPHADGCVQESKLLDSRGVTCAACGLPLWVTPDMSGCGNPRCEAYVPFRRLPDGEQWPKVDPHVTALSAEVRTSNDNEIKMGRRLERVFKRMRAFEEVLKGIAASYEWEPYEDDETIAKSGIVEGRAVFEEYSTNRRLAREVLAANPYEEIR